MTGLAAMVSATDIARAQTVGSAAPSSTTSVTDEEPESAAIADLMGDLHYQVEVWFDHRGDIRRLVLDQTEAFDDLFDRIDDPGETPPSFTSVITLDLFDYGHDVDVDIPDSGDTVDVTEEFARQYE